MPLYTLENDPEYIQLQTELVWLQQHIKELEHKISEQQKEIKQLNEILSDLAIQTR